MVDLLPILCPLQIGEFFLGREVAADSAAQNRRQ
jgi:hypothetical protein